MKLFQKRYSGIIVLMFFTSILCSAMAMAEGKKQVHLLAFSGSIRKESCNKKAIALLARAATEAGAQVTTVDLTNYPMPLYDGDLEAKEGLPDNVKKLQKLVAEHDGLLIASPEYNGQPTPLLKNTLDWLSRAEKDNQKSGLKIFEGKVAAIISASPSQMGGVRGLPLTTLLLSNLGLLVIPQQVAIGNCYDNFHEDGNLKDAKLAAAIKNQATSIVKLVNALRNLEKL